MAHETGKTVREGDPEVSEALDFARWAADVHARRSTTSPPTAWPPTRSAWCSSPARGTSPRRSRPTVCVAALAAGNAVLLKPAPEAVATALELVRLVHEAGHPRRRRAARALPGRRRRPPPRHPPPASTPSCSPAPTTRPGCSSAGTRRCTCSPRRAARTRSSISQTADVDLALRDLVRSAFGHAGQKCSAASLAIVEAPLYDDAGVPRSAGRRRAHAARRAGHRAGDGDGSASSPHRRVRWPERSTDARRRRALARRAAPARRRRPAVVARACASACGRARGSTAPSASGRCSA